MFIIDRKHCFHVITLADISPINALPYYEEFNIDRILDINTIHATYSLARTYFDELDPLLWLRVLAVTLLFISLWDDPFKVINCTNPLTDDEYITFSKMICNATGRTFMTPLLSEIFIYAVRCTIRDYGDTTRYLGYAKSIKTVYNKVGLDPLKILNGGSF